MLSYADQAARRAVYLPSLGSSALFASAETSVKLLQSRWRGFLNRTQLAGELPPGMIRPALWCCPDMGCHRKRPRFCRRSHLCPFCWSRSYVRDVFRWTEKNFFTGGQPRTGLSVLAFQTSHVLSLAEGHQADAAWYASAFQDARQLTAVSRNTERLYYRSAGGVVLHRVVPRTSSVVLRRVGLLAVAGTVEPGVFHDRVRRYDVYDLRLMRDLVSRLCRYPSAFLTMPAAVAGGYLRAFRGARLLSCCAVEDLTRARTETLPTQPDEPGSGSAHRPGTGRADPGYD